MSLLQRQMQQRGPNLVAQAVAKKHFSVADVARAVDHGLRVSRATNRWKKPRQAVTRANRNAHCDHSNMSGPGQNTQTGIASLQAFLCTLDEDCHAGGSFSLCKPPEPLPRLSEGHESEQVAANCALPAGSEVQSSAGQLKADQSCRRHGSSERNHVSHCKDVPDAVARARQRSAEHRRRKAESETRHALAKQRERFGRRDQRLERFCENLCHDSYAFTAKKDLYRTTETCGGSRRVRAFLNSRGRCR